MVSASFVVISRAFRASNAGLKPKKDAPNPKKIHEVLIRVRARARISRVHAPVLVRACVLA